MNGSGSARWKAMVVSREACWSRGEGGGEVGFSPSPSATVATKGDKEFEGV